MIRLDDLRELIKPDTYVCLITNSYTYRGTLESISNSNNRKEVLHYSKNRTNEITIILSDMSY